DEPLPEFEVMHTTRLLLGEQDVEGAVARIESALARFGGVLDVRVAAALVFHACAEGSAQESAERAQWINRRNAQLDWLLAQAAPEDERRIAWAATLRMN
ncbi:MAG: hypothetical protein KDE27_31225, partial [Planctomycetes bacterium]|nr:hypothetical protein [Planctomycetota bacterium]